MPSSTKKAAPAAGNRRDRLASFEATRKKEQRRRSFALLGICLVLALALLAYPLYLFVDDYRTSRRSVSEIGVTAAAAGCDAPTENAATGNQEHVEEGTPVDYAQTPPDSGPHYATAAPFTKHFYSTDDRPEVQMLVHNLEHGYTIAWYRDTAPQEQITQLQQIARTFSDDAYEPTDKFIAAPWSEADGAGFPKDKNVVLTHWYADPANPGNAAQQKGIRQTCTSVSGAAIRDFMTKYPFSDSPEPNAA